MTATLADTTRDGDLRSRWRELLSRRTAVTVGCLAVAAILPIVVKSDYYMSVLVLILLYASLTEALDLVLGRLGLPSVAHGALFAMGAYTLSILTVLHKWPYWAAWVVGIAVTTIVGLLLAVITMRTRGHYFAISSLSFAGAIVIILTQWSSVTRGALGIYGISPPPDVTVLGLHIGFASLQGEYYLSLILLVIIVAALARLCRSAFGRSLELIREDDVLASAVGVHVVAEKIKAFGLSAAMAGAAGGLYASYISYISPGEASLMPGFNVLVYAIIGGTATLAGPIIGPALVVGSTEFLGFAHLWGDFVFAVMLILVLLFFPRGVAGSIGNYRRLVRWRAPAPISPKSPTVTAVSADRAKVPASGRLLPPRRSVPAAASSQAVINRAALLDVTDLSKNYGGVRAVDKVSMEVRPGEIVGVIGPNGAGKSTLFGLIAGTVSASGGSVVFEGAAINKERAYQRARRGIGRTFQTNRLLADKTVLDNLLVASHIHFSTDLLHSLMELPSTKRQLREHIDWLMQVAGALGLLGKEHLPAKALTVEEQKLLGISMALVSEPKLLLLDEPFAGLREAETSRLERLLTDLQRDGMSILLVEHKMKVVMSLCDRCYVLDGGALITQGPPAQVAANEAVIAAYLGTKHA